MSCVIIQSDMTKEERVKKIEEIYNDAKRKLEVLGKEREGIVRNYIKELETKKVGAIRASLGLLDNNQK
jgi:hypothetical protein